MIHPVSPVPLSSPFAMVALATRALATCAPAQPLQAPAANAADDDSRPKHMSCCGSNVIRGLRAGDMEGGSVEEGSGGRWRPVSGRRLRWVLYIDRKDFLSTLNFLVSPGKGSADKKRSSHQTPCHPSSGRAIGWSKMHHDKTCSCRESNPGSWIESPASWPLDDRNKRLAILML